MPKAKAASKTNADASGKDIASDLSYNEAHTALQLTLAALQASDLDVEAMTGLYRQARAYMERCESVLTGVEQEVMLWQEGEIALHPFTDLP